MEKEKGEEASCEHDPYYLAELLSHSFSLRTGRAGGDLCDKMVLLSGKGIYGLIGRRS